MLYEVITIVTGKIYFFGICRCNFSHQRAFAAIAVTAGSKDDTQLFFFESIEHLYHAIRRMGEIHNHVV